MSNLNTRPLGRAIIRAGHHDLREPRIDVVAVTFEWFGRDPQDSACADDAPACLTRPQPDGRPSLVAAIWGGQEKGFELRCNAYGSPALLAIGELDDLLEWLDRWMSDLGSDVAGGHWRDKPKRFPGHRRFIFHDYTRDEIRQEIDREAIWSTLEPFLAADD